MATVSSGILLLQLRHLNECANRLCRLASLYIEFTSPSITNQFLPSKHIVPVNVQYVNW